MQIDWQDEQSVVRDVLRAERRGGPGGRVAVWHAGCVESGGERSGRRDVPYAARLGGRSALGERSPEQDDFRDALRVSKKISVRKELLVRFNSKKLSHGQRATDGSHPAESGNS